MQLTLHSTVQLQHLTYHNRIQSQPLLCRSHPQKNSLPDSHEQQRKHNFKKVEMAITIFRLTKQNYSLNLFQIHTHVHIIELIY